MRSPSVVRGDADASRFCSARVLMAHPRPFSGCTSIELCVGNLTAYGSARMATTAPFATIMASCRMSYVER